MRVVPGRCRIICPLLMQGPRGADPEGPPRGRRNQQTPAAEVARGVFAIMNYAPSAPHVGYVLAQARRC